MQLATFHGLLVDNEESSTRVRMAVIHHIIHGHCFRVTEVENKETRPACKQVSAGFASVRDLSDAVVDSLLQYKDDMSKIPPRKLFDIVSAIDYPRLTPAVNTVNRHDRRDCIQRLKAFRNTERITETQIKDTFSTQFEQMSRASAANIAIHHGMDVPSSLKKEEIKDLIIEHFVSGRCMKDRGLFAPTPDATNLCSRAVGEFLNQDAVPHHPDLFNVYAISCGVKSLTLKAARRLTRLLDIPVRAEDNKSKLVNHIRDWLRRTIKGKARLSSVNDNEHTPEFKADIRRNWPQLVSEDSKAKMISLFKELTSSKHLACVTCASCSVSVTKRNTQTISINELNLQCLKRPDMFENMSTEHTWLDTDVNPPPMPYIDGPLQDLLVDPAGVSHTEEEQILLTLCKTCLNAVKRDEVPPLALANRLFLGDVPPELQDLTVIEEAMIARCRAQCWVVQLKEDNQEIALPTAQRGLKGHIIIYPQNPSAVAQVLPPSIEEITSPLCVLFVGASEPSEQWLREKAKPLAVRGHKVRNALTWLKRNNRYYKDIVIDEAVLQQLDSNPIMPFHIERVNPSSRVDELTSRYDNATASSNLSNEGDVAFQNVVISDVAGTATANELRAAAFRHMKRQGKGYIQIARQSEAVNEFNNPAMLPMCYPTLFPYGIGGSDDPHRPNPVSLKRHVKHLFSMTDQRFQRHYSFMFIVFNILQRREALLRTSLKTKKANFQAVADEFGALSAAAIHAVSERIARGDFTVKTDEEKRVMKLMREVNAVTSHVPGSPASKVCMRNEIRSLIIDQGVPHFYITINPADVYNPLVRFLAGSDIDIDRCLPKDHDYHQQAMLVAKNPAAAAKFFNIYMKAFIYALLGFNDDQKISYEGILGNVKAYYGTVEAQGRGTLHCHMMIWLEGGLHPDEVKSKILQEGGDDFKQRLFSFLDDSISTELPPDTSPQSEAYHPCAVRGPLSEKPEDIQKDRHLLVLRCQYHTHSKTCYKYDPSQCRFELGEGRQLRPVTMYNSDTGEIEHRCLHALVNNFNATMLSALRCNMDIKYIGSGASAKAVIFYITDYITKSQLQAHVAYAALELAYKKLEEVEPSDDNVVIHAKRLLQKCVYALISHQEMSAQQVVSYLMDFEDHFTSHRFVNVVWPSFERFVNQCDPSPECYPSSPAPDRLATHGDNTDTAEYDIRADALDAPSQLQSNANTADGDDILAAPQDSAAHLDEMYESEITIRTASDGSVVPKVSAVEDYVHRGPLLADLSVWDYFSRVEKSSKQGDRRKHRIHTDDEEPSVPDSEFPEEEITNNEGDPTDSDGHEFLSAELRGILWDWHYHSNHLLTDIRRKRPRVSFSPVHSEHATHYQKIRPRQSRLIPVPIGPSIPRRDRDELKEKHARLMLVLFKPWSNTTHLRDGGTTWSDAYASFLQNCEPRVCKLIDHMQVLHECCDARDDHFANRSKQAHAQRSRDLHSEANHLGETLTEELLHEHLRQIQDFQSDNVSSISATASACLTAVNASGYFSAEQSTQEAGSSGTDPISSFVDQETCVTGPADNNLELIWKQAYERRKLNHKISFMHTETEIATEHATAQTQVTSGMQLDIHLSNSIPMDVDNDASSHGFVSGDLQSLHAGHAQFDMERAVDFVSLASEWHLNKEQTIAFRMIVTKSLAPFAEPLRLIIAGQGGTGKSRVIQAVADYFDRTNQCRRLRLASYTGIAAKNINGSTLHSTLSLSSFSSGKVSTTSNSDLVSMWQGVDFLFIDEFSMIGCGLLYEISRALSVAKENAASFRGINVIFAGDFAQLPPVGYKRLYTNLIHRQKKGSHLTASEKDVIGKLLWLSIRNVVVLKEVWRQKVQEGHDAVQVNAMNMFVDLLVRLREGRCTDEDYQLLCTRLVGNVQPEWSSEKWKRTPMIVSQNEAKDVLNNAATVAFAKRSGRELHWYYAIDRHDGKTLRDRDLLQHLRSLNSSVTNYRQGKLPLVVGMPVMVTSNFDVEGGVVNGCAGTLVSIRYWVDSEGERHALSCVIRSNTFRGDALPTLQEHDAVAIADDKPIRFVHPASGKKCTIKRFQLPVLPAFAMTAHKSQGLTLPSAMIDLESCRGLESPYVMISRVKSLDDLLIMRPFAKDRICRRLSEDVRRELGRLSLLECLTLVEHGTPTEIEEAKNELTRKGLIDLVAQQYEDVDIDNADLAGVHAHQDQICKWVNTFEMTDHRQRPKNRMRRGCDEQLAEPPRKRMLRDVDTAATAPPPKRVRLTRLPVTDLQQNAQPLGREGELQVPT